MSESRILRKKLWGQLGKIKAEDWIIAGECLGLKLTRGAKHTCVLRDPKYPDCGDIRSLVVTIQENLYKQANQHIFKHLLDYGFSEDQIWISLRMLSE